MVWIVSQSSSSAHTYLDRFTFCIYTELACRRVSAYNVVLVLGMGSASEMRRYMILIDWPHTQNDPQKVYNWINWQLLVHNNYFSHDPDDKVLIITGLC